MKIEPNEGREIEIIPQNDWEKMFLLQVEGLAYSIERFVDDDEDDPTIRFLLTPVCKK